MRRFRLVLGVLSLLTGIPAPAGAAHPGPPAARARVEGCVSAGQATYRHTFDGGAGVAAVTAVSPLCPGQSQAFSLISYTTPGSSFGYPQFIYDEARATIDAGHGSVRLAATVPGCYFQVDLIFGTGVHDEVIDADSNYGNLKLGAPYGIGSRSSGPYGGDADGSSPCVPKPTVTYVDDCDGTFTATLADDPTANVDAVFLIAGRRIHVAPGHTASERHSGTLTVRDNTYTTHIGSWQQPPTGCASPAPPSPAVASPSGAPPPPPTSAGDEASPPAPSDSLSAASPAPLDAPSSANASSRPAAARPGGLDTSSRLVIGLGVFLILAGLVVLIRVLRTFREP